MKILIVEDMSVIRKGIVGSVSKTGLGSIIFEAANGEEGLSIIREENPELVITDIKMPLLDGIDMIQLAKNEGFTGEFLVITGFAEFEYARQAINLGVKGLLLKPLDEEKLIKQIKDIYQVRGQDKVEEITLSNNINRVFLDQERDSVVIAHKKHYVLLLIHFNKTSMSQSHRRDIKMVLKQMDLDMSYNLSENYRNYHEHFLTLFHDQESVLRVGAKDVALKLLKGLSRFNLQVFIGVSNCHREICKELYVQVKRTMVKRLYKSQGWLAYDGKNNNVVHEIKDKILLIEKYIKKGELKKIQGCIKEIFTGPSMKNASYITFEEVYHDLMELGASDQRKGLSYYESIDQVMEAILGSIALKVKEQEVLQIDNVAIELIKDYMDSHLYSNTSVKDIASHFNISNSYLTNLFKKHYQVTPNTYMTQKRIEKSCSLLVHSERTVSDIAEEVGYQDAQYFYRVFKKITGFTPLRYRVEKK